MTRCPVCKNSDLRLTRYDDALPVSECSSCGGSWIRANEYSLWLKTQIPGKYDLSNAREVSSRLPVKESDHAAICPDCGHFLRKYQVTSSFTFYLDRCNNCNGVWLDRNEWQTLKEVGLHDEINEIFTKPWQKHIQDEVTASRMEAMYLERFGRSDYEKIKEIKKWLHENPNRNLLIAYLLDKNPYSA